MTDKELKEKAESFADRFDYTDNYNYENNYKKSPYDIAVQAYIAGAIENGNKITWYDVKEKLPPQEGHTCFSKHVMTDTGHWCYFDFAGHKWFWNNRKINIKKWCNFEIPDFEEDK